MTEFGKNPGFDRPPEQLLLKLEVAAEREIEGVGMGVLSNGTPFLTVSGLARMCGLDSGTIVRITAGWQANPLKPREQKIRELIRTAGGDDTRAFIAIPRAGTIYHAVPDAVCMAVLEYYAFEARGDNDQASKSYRTLARKGFQDFIYSQVGWSKGGAADAAWQQFHDRVGLTYHTVPDGYFSIFKELADFNVTLLRQGASLGSKFIPDISVGMAWGKYWLKEKLDRVFGERIRYGHNYPSYFPQSLSNPQPAFCYPDAALAEFRKWLKTSYVPNQMPAYLLSKVHDKSLPAPAVNAALRAFAPRGTIGPS